MMQLPIIITICLSVIALVHLPDIVGAVVLLPSVIAQATNYTEFVCGESNLMQSVDNCRHFTLYFTIASTLTATLLTISTAISYRRILPTISVMICSAATIYLANNSITTALVDRTTYAQEWTVAALHMLLWLMPVILPFALFAPRVWMLVDIGIITICATIIIALNGSASELHISSLLPIFAEPSSYMVMVYGCVLLFALLIAVPAQIGWVDSGDWPSAQQISNRCAQGLAVILLLCIPFLSIPLGKEISKNNISRTKAYIDNNISPVITTYYRENEQYPMHIGEVNDMPAYEELPRLLHWFDYQSPIGKGAFFLSRPQKYCIIFFDYSAGRQGFFSNIGESGATTARGWKFHPITTTPVEERYAELCDEETPIDALIGDYLDITPATDLLKQAEIMTGEITYTPQTSASQHIVRELAKQHARQDDDRKEESAKDSPSITAPSGDELGDHYNLLKQNK